MKHDCCSDKTENTDHESLVGRKVQTKHAESFNTVSSYCEDTLQVFVHMSLVQNDARGIKDLSSPLLDS